MTLNEIYKDKRLLNEMGAQINVSVNLNDLRDFAMTIIQEWIAKQEAQRPQERDRYLYIEEVCERLKVNRSTLHRWNKSGALKPVRVGGRPRYRELDINAFAER